MSAGELFAQNYQPQVVQLSGVVVGQDSTRGVPGVHIYVPKAGRGTTSNIYGYFSMPALVGDSVVVSAVGFQKQNFIVPGVDGESFTVVIELVEDTTYLQELEIFPYPTEELFKEAILALELPYQDDLDRMNRGLDQEILARMYANMPMDAYMNYRYYRDQQLYWSNNRWHQPSVPLLNPFAWAEFIKSVKRGDLKKKGPE